MKLISRLLLSATFVMTTQVQAFTVENEFQVSGKNLYKVFETRHCRTLSYEDHKAQEEADQNANLVCDGDIAIRTSEYALSHTAVGKEKRSCLVIATAHYACP